MNDSTMNEVTKMGAAAKKDYRKMPKIKYFRVQSRGAVGTMDNRHDRAVGAWAVLVDCGDNKGLRLVTDIAYEMGMVVKGEFKTRDDAFKAAMEYKAKWGAVGAKTKKQIEREESIRKNVIAELAKMTPEQVAELISKAA